MYTVKKCIVCGEAFAQRSHRHECCSKECRQKNYNRKSQSDLIESKKYTCVVCDKKGISKNAGSKQKYCSKECEAKFLGRRTTWYGLPSGTVGALQELRASVDLMIKGWEVFRALSPSSSCDLLGFKNDKMIKIEVRTGYKNEEGKIFCKRQNKADCLAIALPNEIVYEPELPE